MLFICNIHVHLISCLLVISRNKVYVNEYHSKLLPLSKGHHTCVMTLAQR